MTRTLSLALVLMLGCGDPEATPDAPPASGDAARADAAAGNCPAGVLCLRANKVVPDATIPDGRLVVAFVQLSDEVDPYPDPQIGYDAPFSGTAPTMGLPLPGIALPAPIDDFRFCVRTCQDLTNPACDCPAAAPKAALAYVIVAQDTDGSGAIELAELEDYYGAGVVQIGAADASYPAPNALDLIFTEGIVEGVAPYEVIDVPDDVHDALGVPPAGTVFDLDLCVPADASCDALRLPELS